MYLVTQGKRRENQLGYDPKTGEYVCFHHGIEVWREKGDITLLNYFNAIRAGINYLDEDSIEKLPTASIWKKYGDTCLEFQNKEFKQPTMKIVEVIR